MKAIILAAGRGNRMGNVTKHLPKGLIQLGGRPLLHWQTHALMSAGITDITLVTGYKHEKYEPEGFRTRYNSDWANTNMVASLLCAEDIIDEPTIVSYSDIIYEANIVSDLILSHGDLCISYDQDWLNLWRARFDDPLSDAESFKIDGTHRITEIGKQVKDLDEIQGQYIGLLRFNSNSISWARDVITSDRSLLSNLDMTGLLNRLILAGRTIQGVGVRAGWCEIDSPTDLLVAEKLLQEGKLNIFSALYQD